MTNSDRYDIIYLPVIPGRFYEGGCGKVNFFIAFLYAVMANVISDYISKWLDGRK